MTDHKIYAIPARFRRIENMHILLWLIKDACWAMNYRTMGMIMIIPTLFVAFFITWQTRHILSEFLHNLAVVFWIIANCTWMVGEFYGWDAKSLGGNTGSARWPWSLFCIGLLILIYYYLFLASKKSFQEKMYAKTEEAVKEELAD